MKATITSVITIDVLSIESFPIVQDGRDFYHNGKLIFTAKTKVKDFDLTAAAQARQEFTIWAATQEINPTFVL